MQDDVPFSKLFELLEKHGYQLLRRNKDPGEQNAGFAIFCRQGSPNIGIPVRNRRVEYEHYQALYEALESSHEGGESH
jgi:hypothetical protein